MRDKILAMEAGKLLDHLIAEDVMGWTRKGDCWFTTDGNVRTDETTSYKSFQPSTDISAAFEVIEKLRPKYMIYVMFGTDKGVTCKIREDGKSAVVGKSYSDTAPEAICKAALLAVMNS